MSSTGIFKRLVIRTGDSEIVDVNNVSITSVTQGFLGFLVLRGPADGAYPGPEGWKLKPYSSENETVPVGGQLGNGRGYQGERRGCSLLGSSRCLGGYPCPRQNRLSFPGEEERPGPVVGVRPEVPAQAQPGACLGQEQEVLGCRHLKET